MLEDILETLNEIHEKVHKDNGDFKEIRRKLTSLEKAVKERDAHYEKVISDISKSIERILVDEITAEMPENVILYWNDLLKAVGVNANLPNNRTHLKEVITKMCQYDGLPYNWSSMHKVRIFNMDSVVWLLKRMYSGDGWWVSTFLEYQTRYREMEPIIKMALDNLETTGDKPRKQKRIRIIDGKRRTPYEFKLNEDGELEENRP